MQSRFDEAQLDAMIGSGMNPRLEAALAERVRSRQRFGVPKSLVTKSKREREEEERRRREQLLYHAPGDRG